MFFIEQSIRYFDIAWMSEEDGPGMRIVVFLQGCNLRCSWCHSPHSWRDHAPILLNKNLCNLCGACSAACKKGIHRIDGHKHYMAVENCIGCGACIEACPSSVKASRKGPLYLPTRELAVQDLYKLLEPQLLLLKRIGGITLSGGEALLQYKGAVELLKICKENGIHTAVETSGFLPLKIYKYAAEYIDCWLLGIRGIEEGSEGFARLEENLSFLSTLSKQIIVRTPIVCGYTDSEAQLHAIKHLMNKYSVEQIQLLPYNTNTPHYYEAMGLAFDIGDKVKPSGEYMEELRRYFKAGGLHCEVVGESNYI